MALSIGIIGLPNAGKSTLFNALMRRQIAQVAEYPYTTIEPNVGVVEVSDGRLSSIAFRLSVEKVVPAAIRFIDIAGLIKGAAQGEGLGNQFLSHIREVDAIVHVVRVFENENVPHVAGEINPIADIAAVNSELGQADIKKPMIFVLNCSENMIKDSSTVQTTELISNKYQSAAVAICGKLEAELADLSIGEQREYLLELGLHKSALDQVIAQSYKLLDLITFFTIAGGKMVQAWPIKEGSTMIEAAGMVHTDFARGFIAAEVCDWQKLVNAGSWHAAGDKGLIHTAGRDEKASDGEVVEFRSNV